MLTRLLAASFLTSTVATATTPTVNTPTTTSTIASTTTTTANETRTPADDSTNVETTTLSPEQIQAALEAATAAAEAASQAEAEATAVEEQVQQALASCLSALAIAQTTAGIESEAPQNCTALAVAAEAAASAAAVATKNNVDAINTLTNTGEDQFTGPGIESTTSPTDTDASTTSKTAAISVSVALVLLAILGGVFWWSRHNQARKANTLVQIAMDELGHNGAPLEMMNNPMRPTAAVINPNGPPAGVGRPKVKLIPNVLYGGVGGGGQGADDDRYSGYAPPETAFQTSSNAATQSTSSSIVYAIPMEGGDAVYNAVDANGRGLDVAGHVLDATNPTVEVAEHISSTPATHEQTYAGSDGSSATTCTSTASSSGNSTIYDMGPESEQQGRQQHDGGGGAAVHAPKSRPDENNVYDMQVPGMKSKGAAAATAARVATEAGSGSGAGAGGGGAAKQCTRPSPTGGTCTNKALPGGGGLFCKAHTCPECGAGKSSSEFGCPAHLSRPRKQSVYAGFEEERGGGDGTEA
jgi:hypothetical protein